MFNTRFVEEVIRRRLLIDGDGTGDDRRLNVLLKTFNKWSQMPNDTESQLSLDRMLAQLAQCEFAVKKSQISAKMSARELQNYEKISEEIETNIENVKELIETSKNDLTHAKTVRKNKMEYDVLARIINEQADRKETDNKLSELQKELTLLEEKSLKLEAKLDMRRKQFYVLGASIAQLKAMVESDNNVEDLGLEPFDDDITEICNSPVPDVTID